MLLKEAGKGKEEGGGGKGKQFEGTVKILVNDSSHSTGGVFFRTRALIVREKETHTRTEGGERERERERERGKKTSSMNGQFFPTAAYEMFWLSAAKESAVCRLYSAERAHFLRGMKNVNSARSVYKSYQLHCQPAT